MVASRSAAQSAAKQSDGVTYDVKAATVLTAGGDAAAGMAAMLPASTGRAVAVKADSAMRKIRMLGMAVRSKTSTHSDTGGGAGIGTEATSEISNIRRTKVDETLFVIPADYTKGASPFPTGG